jgi:hypothetical protein
MAASRLKHGQAGARTAEYSAWINMKARCYNPNSNRFSDYGGRDEVEEFFS